MRQYFVVERQNIGIDNWESLQNVFESMGEPGQVFPAYINHSRTRLDGDAVIYEAKFEPDEVSGASFRQMLADAFSVDVQDIEYTTSQESYAGHQTNVWVYSYNTIERFTVRRFGAGGTWLQSRNECAGYLFLNNILWESIE